MRHFLSALSLFLGAGLTVEAAQTIEFTVSAGKFTRVNEPVCIPLQLDVKTPPTAAVTIEDDAGQFVATGQFTGPDLLTESVKAAVGKQRLDLHLLLPKLEAGKSLRLRAIVADQPRQTAKDDFHFHSEVSRDEHWTELRRGERPIMRYLYTPLDESSKEARDRTFKVFHHVYDPTGERFLTNGAGGRFPHHRGLFYGFMRCSYGKNTVDTWHCPAPDPKGKRNNEAHQAHSGVKSISTGPVLGRHIVEIDWNGVGKKTFAREQRQLTVYSVPGGTLIDFVSKLTPTDEPVKLDGDPQHAGFHFRAANEVSDKTAKQTIFIRPDGTDKPGATRNWDGKQNTTHVNLPWLAMSFVVNNQRYTCAYLDRPDNPKEARFSERDYGRFGSYFVTTVTKEKPLVVRYRVWLQAGQMTPDAVKALSEVFVTPVEVKVKGPTAS